MVNEEVMMICRNGSKKLFCVSKLEDELLKQHSIAKNKAKKVEKKL